MYSKELGHLTSHPHSNAVQLAGTSSHHGLANIGQLLRSAGEVRLPERQAVGGEGGQSP